MSETMFFEGNKTKVTLPSGRIVTIRETNGGDDELLSSLGDIKESNNITNFLASIITEDEQLKKKPLASEVLNYHLNDRWYLMLKQRLINRGPELIFHYTCPENACKKKGSQEFTEDLSLLDADLSNSDYKPKSLQIWKYPMGLNLSHEIKTSSGRLFKFDIMTGVHEKILLDVPDMGQNKNTPLVVRNLSIRSGDTWEVVTNFSGISSRELSHIRAEVVRIDRDYNPIINGDCQYCKKPFAMMLFGIPDFFWPGETI